MIRSIAWSLILILITPCLFASELETHYLIRITAGDKMEFQTLVDELRKEHYDVAGSNMRQLWIDLVVDQTQYQALDTRFEVQVLRSPGKALLVDPQYYDPAEMSTLIQSYATQYPDLTHLVTIGQTEQNRTMYAIKISDNPDIDEDELAISFNGQHHAREVMTSQITMDIIDYLLTNYGTDPDVTYWVDTFEIWVIPQVNLDGINYVFTSYDMWRKDRHNPPSGYSDYGIDPNRNYPSFWGSCNGSSGYPGDDDYRGQSPAESFCVDNMMQFETTVKPVFSISYHSYGEYVIYPYGCEGAAAPDHETFVTIGQELASVIQRDDGGMGYDPGRCWEVLWYATDGGDIEWYYTDLGTFPFVLEVNASGFLPSYSTWRDITVQRNRAGWQYLLNRLDGAMITGHIVDACTGDPISGAEFSLQENPLTSDELPRVSNDFGRYWYPVLPGTWHLIVSAPGYGDIILPVNVGNQQLVVDVGLVPDGSFGIVASGQVIHDADGDDDAVLDIGETALLELQALSIGSTTNVVASLTSSDPYIAILDDYAVIGNIPDGSTGSTVAPHFQIQSSPTTPEGHVAELTVTFDATQELCSASSTISVLVSNYVYQCPLYAENLDANPNYTIVNVGSNGWEFGQPSGGVSAPYSGTYCYGTNLDGNYSNNASYTLTSTPFDCSQVEETELHFYRYLQNETNWDEAYVDVSNNNSTWTNVWTGYAQDTAWTEQVFDISAVADGEPTVYVRWRLETDSSVVDLGFYIDDISICGKSVPDVTPTPAPTWTPAPTSTPEECVHTGDVNLDASVTAGDAQTAFLIALGSYTPTWDEECRADCNGDGGVTAGDAQGIFLLALGGASCADPLPIL